MSFAESGTYIYAYVAFAIVYLVGSVVSAVSALRVSTGISRASDTGSVTVPSGALRDAVHHGRRLVDYTQVSTLLPLVYIVGSMFLGSFIAKDVDLARVINVAWVVFTLVCAATAVALSFMALREARAVRPIPADGGTASGDTPEALRKVSVRLGVSAALLLLVAVFTMLNLWSVVGNIGTLSATGFTL